MAAKYLTDKTPLPSNKNSYVLKFDGSCWPNPGPMACAYFIFGHKQEPLVRYTKMLGNGTNNEAELYALLYGLRHCIRLGIRNLHVFGDSKLAINLAKDVFQTRKRHLSVLTDEIRSISKLIFDISFTHVERKYMSDVDEWSKAGLEEYMDGPDGLHYNQNGKRLLTEQQAGLVQLGYIKGLCKVKRYYADIMQISPKAIESIVNFDSHAFLTEDIFKTEDIFL